MAEMKEEESRANVEQEEIPSAENATRVAAGASTTVNRAKLPISIINVVFEPLSQGLTVLVDFSLDESSWNEDFKIVKEKLDRFLEEVDEYKIKKNKLDMTLLKRLVAIKTLHCF